jgi:hypothetical protein
MSGNHFYGMTVDELQSYFSDFYKDYYGFRPRFATTEHWNSSEWLIEQINFIHDDLDRRKKTPAGRESLRAEGWQIDEEDYL